MSNSKRVIDFDKFRAESKDEPVEFIIGGKTYNLPSSLPASMAVDVLRMKADMDDDEEVPAEQMDTFGRSLFGPTMWEALLNEHRITVDEISPLMEQVFEAYMGEPEESADPKSESPTSESEASASA